jgi:hypothetical protein
VELFSHQRGAGIGVVTAPQPQVYEKEVSMADALGAKPEWLTFDCYGTLIQWDEGLIAAVQKILKKTVRCDHQRHNAHPGLRST